MRAVESFYNSKEIITKKMKEARTDNPSWNTNFPKGSENGPLSDEEKGQKRLRKIAYVYDYIMKFKIFLEKRDKALKLTKDKENLFITAINNFVNAQDNIDVMTSEMRDYVDDKQIFHRRFRREGIDEAKKPKEKT